MPFTIETGRGGGFIIALHSIGLDISAETLDYVLDVLDVLDECGAYGVVIYIRRREVN